MTVVFDGLNQETISMLQAVQRSYFSFFCLILLFCFGYPRAVSKFRELLLKYVHYLYDCKGQCFSIIAQFGAQYDIILKDFPSLN